MKSFLILLFTILSIPNAECYSQIDYIKYKIDRVGSISISPKMELQSGDYKQGAENYIKSQGITITGNRIVFQQKGLNELSSSSFNSYARIIFETTIGSIGDFEKLGSVATVSVAELNEVSSVYKQQFLQQYRGTTMKLILWHGASIEKVNGQTCIKYSYVRQLGNNPPVEVASYIFQNNDRMHTITVSYRKNDKNTWGVILTNSLNSFKIENIR
ncbi:hypothetical protein FACS1894179_02960 [Bacteroidia bacterium]|nr:hypothetical protein FACS1894179_02960 [Bacteroidia bacterium]